MRAGSANGPKWSRSSSRTSVAPSMRSAIIGAKVAGPPPSPLAAIVTRSVELAESFECPRGGAHVVGAGLVLAAALDAHPVVVERFEPEADVGVEGFGGEHRQGGLRGEVGDGGVEAVEGLATSAGRRGERILWPGPLEGRKDDRLVEVEVREGAGPCEFGDHQRRSTLGVPEGDDRADRAPGGR